MRIITKSLKCSQSIRFFVLYLVFSIFFLLNLNRWTTLLELVIASSFLPFYGYLALTIGRQYLIALYYGTKRAEIDTDLTRIAKEENPKIKKVVVKEIGRPYAYASRFTNTIILSRKLVDSLEDDEIRAVLHHEIGHGGFHPLPARVLLLIVLVPAFILLYVAIFGAVHGVLNLFHQFLDAFYLTFVSSFLFCLFFFFVERKMHWASEFKADKRAAERVNVASIVSALRKVVPPELVNCDSPTHPSMKRRIANLRNKESLNK